MYFVVPEWCWAHWDKIPVEEMRYGRKGRPKHGNGDSCVCVCAYWCWCTFFIYVIHFLGVVFVLVKLQTLSSFMGFPFDHGLQVCPAH